MKTLAPTLALLALLVVGGHSAVFGGVVGTPDPASGLAPPGYPRAVLAASSDGSASVAAGDVDGYRQALRSAMAELQGGRPGAARRVAAALRSVEPIALSDGSQVTPDLAALVAALESQPPDLAPARAGLRALIDELDRPQPFSTAAPGSDARDRLRRILERPEFRTDRKPNPLGSLLEQLWRLLGEWLGLLLGPVAGWLAERWQGLWGDEGRRANLLLLAELAGLVALVGLVAWVVRGLRRVVGPALVGAPPVRAAAVATAEALRAKALRLAQAGDFRAAMRALYLAALLRWDEQGGLRFDRTLTNREMLARASREADRALVDRLAPLVERFDRLWYGGAPCSPEDYADFAQLATAAWEAT